MNSRVCIIDAMNLFHRLLHTRVSNLMSDRVFEELSFIETGFGITRCIAVFEGNGPTWRHEMYPEYKAGRPEKDAEFYEKRDEFRKILSNFGVYCVSYDGYEADDIIGSYAKILSSNQYTPYIYSNDKDFIQLISDKVFLINPSKRAVLTTEEVVAKYEVHPSKFLEYLALMGDAADNIKGVYGIGPKAAQKIVSGAPIDLKTLSKLQKSQNELHLAKKLVEIYTDVDVHLPVDSEMTIKKTIA